MIKKKKTVYIITIIFSALALLYAIVFIFIIDEVIGV